MITIRIHAVRNGAGAQLVDAVAALCTRRGIRLQVVPYGERRDHRFFGDRRASLVLWDCSIEEGHIYSALHDWVKRGRQHVIVSRTPLPRNVIAYYVFAPRHGAATTNAEIVEWLDRQLPRLLRREGNHADAAPASHVRHYWMLDDRSDVFVSYRGTHAAEAYRYAEELLARGQSARIVPEGEHAYATECVTLQQRWETVAKLAHELRSCGRAVALMSLDYWDSFWTASEMLSMIAFAPRSIRFLYPGETVEKELVAGAAGGVRSLTPRQRKLLLRLLNNTDPETQAPDTRIEPRGTERLLAFVLRHTLGYYDPQMTGERFWRELRVPCPTCAPRHRRPDAVDWDRHLDLQAPHPVDDYGYFAAPQEVLTEGAAICPRCATKLRVRNTRPPRYLWIPPMATKRDRSPVVLEEYPVWEIATGPP